MYYAASAEAARRLQTSAQGAPKPALRDYRFFYRNLSMDVATDLARDLHGSLYYGHNVLWNRLIKPTNTKRYVLNRLAANVAALGTDFLAIKLPYGFAFLHEEFHRAVMAEAKIYSYDEVWNFGKGFDIAVTQVKDADLIQLKKTDPAMLTRLAAAGVEAEYVFIRRMRGDNFFERTDYPYLGLSLIGTIHAVSYVNLPLSPRFNAITDSILAHDKHNELARDFTGYDFSAWVYDLFTPDAPYTDRGTWPGGSGIKRPVKADELTAEMKAFLRETGKMQYINFASPFLVGINRLRVGENKYFNFALRSVPTSFGYFSGGDFYFDFNDNKYLISAGVNRSQYLTLPFLQGRYYDAFTLLNERLSADVQLGAWLQPKEQRFAAKEAAPGLEIKLTPKYKLTERTTLTSEVSWKSDGWVFGNSDLDAEPNLRVGLSFRAGKLLAD